MNTNALLTYLLYALLAGLILVAGYKTCQMRQDKANMAREQEELQQNLRDLGYIDDDTTGTRFNDQPETSGSPAVSTDGIEDDYETPSPVPAPAKTTPKTTTKPAPVNTTPAAQPAPVQQAPSSASPRDTAPPANDGRYRVVAGSFTVLDGARQEMERLIKMGYHEAEVGQYNRGKFAVVIVKRTNDLDEANRLAHQLKRRGIDASVIDRERKQ